MTAGFENHTPMLCTVSLEGGDGELKGEVKVQDGMAVRNRLVLWTTTWERTVDLESPPVKTECFGYLNRREAIFLRNKLNAFIEKGLDDVMEEMR